MKQFFRRAGRKVLDTLTGFLAVVLIIAMLTGTFALILALLVLIPFVGIVRNAWALALFDKVLELLRFLARD